MTQISSFIKNNWAIILLFMGAGIIVWLAQRKNSPIAPSGEKETESSYNPFKQQSAILDNPGTTYVISKTGNGLTKSGNIRVIKGRPVTKISDCAAILHEGRWYVGIDYSAQAVWVTPDLLKRA